MKRFLVGSVISLGVFFVGIQFAQGCSVAPYGNVGTCQASCPAAPTGIWANDVACTGGDICCYMPTSTTTTTTTTTTTAATTSSVSCPGGTIVSGVCIPGGTGLSSYSVDYLLMLLMDWLLAIFGFIAIIAFIISGMQYLLSAGDDGAAETAKRNMKYSIIGIMVALSGFVIIYAIDQALSGNPYF